MATQLFARFAGLGDSSAGDAGASSFAFPSAKNLDEVYARLSSAPWRSAADAARAGEALLLAETRFGPWFHHRAADTAYSRREDVLAALQLLSLLTLRKTLEAQQLEGRCASSPPTGAFALAARLASELTRQDFTSCFALVDQARSMRDSLDSLVTSALEVFARELRDAQAELAETAYTSMRSEACASMLGFTTPVELQEFATRRGWRVEGDFVSIARGGGSSEALESRMDVVGETSEETHRELLSQMSRIADHVVFLESKLTTSVEVPETTTNAAEAASRGGARA